MKTAVNTHLKACRNRGCLGCCVQQLLTLIFWKFPGRHRGNLSNIVTAITLCMALNHLNLRQRLSPADLFHQPLCHAAQTRLLTSHK